MRLNEMIAGCGARANRRTIGREYPAFADVNQANISRWEVSHGRCARKLYSIYLMLPPFLHGNAFIIAPSTDEFPA
jgi:hypothetical protein